ncbi:hypothetical protein FHX52_4497 [Humibacillus xanthopallidus]|uniref:Uncharacterized protein n=1 Tax=Humibacillus xanthopallidus TaxID=412689 RepID=A0A543PMF2_9MICO|nr:hypothetical protein [Humibacillus xanthopallidus]TQN45258.1 hypothetical protein FHX52_4497 [Humibacillus xanthopallidus]
MAKPATTTKPVTTTTATTAAPPRALTAAEARAAAHTIERAKVLSVRLSAEEFEQLTEVATEIGVGPSTLARTLIRRGLTPSTTDITESPLERAYLQRLPQQPSDIEELTARVAALEAWVASHSNHDAT